MPKLIHCRWLLLGLLPLVTLAQGQENAPNPQLLSDTDTWTSPRYALQVTPYAWVTGLSGESSPFKRAPTLDIEKSFSDVFHDLRAAAFINTWARHDRYVLNSDLLYVNTRESEVVGGLPFVGAAEGTVDTRLFMASLQGGYRVYDSEQASVDALAGFSFWDIRTRAHLTTAGRTKHHQESFSWVDPAIGLRAFYRFTPELSTQAQIHLGGFDVGSRMSYQATLTLNYDLSDNFSVAAGYKMLNVNYRRSGHVFDTRMSGPVIGLTWRY
ncbi:MAG: hypothetical protein ACTJHY_06210 [Alcaligenes pakistanensis]